MISEISTNKYKVNVGPQSIPASHTEKKKQLMWRWYVYAFVRILQH